MLPGPILPNLRAHAKHSDRSFHISLNNNHDILTIRSDDGSKKILSSPEVLARRKRVVLRNLLRSSLTWEIEDGPIEASLV